MKNFCNLLGACGKEIDIATQENLSDNEKLLVAQEHHDATFAQKIIKKRVLRLNHFAKCLDAHEMTIWVGSRR